MIPWEGDKPCGYQLKDGRVCTQGKGHYAQRGDTRNGSEHGHGKPPYWRRPELCPHREDHYEHVFAGRLSVRYGNLTRNGVSETLLIDKTPASKHYSNEHCPGCELALIWSPK